MKHIIYRTHNQINQKEYTGKHSTNDLEDGYFGSGKAIVTAVNKYGLENFAVEILSFHENSEEAFAEEERIVDEEYIRRTDTYNIKLGGDGGWDHLTGTFVTMDDQGKFYRKACCDKEEKDGLFVAIDKNGNTIVALKNDPRLETGEISGVSKNTVTVKDKEGNNLRVSNIDPRYLSGELVAVSKDKIIVKDKSSNTFQIDKDDPRFLSGELVGIMKGVSNKGINLNTVTVKDKEGNNLRVSCDDPRYLSRELVGITKYLTMYKDKSGNTFQTSVDDPRVISGELVGVMKGHKHKQVTCPWCGKSGGAGGIKSFHFDYCKENPNRKVRSVKK